MAKLVRRVFQRGSPDTQSQSLMPDLPGEIECLHSSTQQCLFRIWPFPFVTLNWIMPWVVSCFLLGKMSFCFFVYTRLLPLLPMPSPLHCLALCALVKHKGFPSCFTLSFYQCIGLQYNVTELVERSTQNVGKRKSCAKRASRNCW